jgi:phosphatidylinositol glycan class N
MLARFFSSKANSTIVAVGVVFHLVYLVSIVDIYFRTPLVHGVEPIPFPGAPPAKRLVLFVADGLRADKLFEQQSGTPFLREIIETKGSWGISHTRVPTESRPGHVAMIAGFYEDVSAVTKGWKENPVEFDSVFNRTRYTWSWGSPDILPIFAKDVDHIYMDMYEDHSEDFSKDATKLDTWVFDKVQHFLANAKKDAQLYNKLQSEKIVFFLHLLGIDTTGHAKRPYSKHYIDNIKIVDQGVHKIYDLIEDFYPDKSTAYIFTADHGMSDKGNHGDGEKANTETPLIAWGAGINKPQFEEAVQGHGISPPSWRVNHLKRFDVEQADIAPLMATLIGASIPINSIGVLPLNFIDNTDAFKAEVLFTNAKEIGAQYTKKSELKAKNTLFFKPFEPLKSIDKSFDEIARDIKLGKYQQAEEQSLILIRLCLKGLHYLQVYDWPFLMSSVVAGYVAWIIHLLLLVLNKSYHEEERLKHLKEKHTGVYVLSALFTGAMFAYLALQWSPIQYYLYVGFAIYYWTNILKQVNDTRRILNKIGFSGFNTALYFIVFVAALEIFVLGFIYRSIYALVFAILALWGLVQPALSATIKAMWCLLCGCMAIYPLLPVNIGSSIGLVSIGGALITLMGIFSTSKDLKLFFASGTIGSDPSIISPVPKSAKHILQIACALAATVMTYTTDVSLQNNYGLPIVNQYGSWAVLVVSIAMALYSESNLFDLLFTLFLGLGTPYIMFSVSYEALFFVTFAVLLFVWLIVEKQLFVSRAQRTGESHSSLADEARIALFYLFFCYMAFFGTGNIASISSFEISSTYRFVTVFRPFLMTSLLLLKVLIPFALVAGVFGSMSRMRNSNVSNMFYFVLAFSDVMTLNFFFLVKDEGSWLEIGTSISQFALTNLFIIMQLILFAISHLLLRRLRFAADPNKRD